MRVHRQCSPGTVTRPSSRCPAQQPCSPVSGVPAASARGSMEGTSQALAPLGGPLVPWEPGVTYQTLAGTLCCHVTGDGTWKTLKGKRKISEMTFRDVVPRCRPLNMCPPIWWQPALSPGEPGPELAGLGQAAGDTGASPSCTCSLFLKRSSAPFLNLQRSGRNRTGMREPVTRSGHLVVICSDSLGAPRGRGRARQPQPR